MQRNIGILVAIVAMVVAGMSPTAPAGALTGNEKLVYAVHQDFLLRDPAANELLLWTTFLGGNSRAAMVSAILNSDEFADLWVFGSTLYYLEETTLPEQLSIATNLKANGNFVASEVAIMASSTYFTASGGTNTTFVQNVYQDVLHRQADASGLSYWVGRLNAGTSTRSAIANYFVRTSEGAARRVSGTSGMTSCVATELIDVESITSGSYCIVLDRLADASGATYWASQLAATGQMPSLWASLAGSAEYYNKAQARF